MKMYEYQIGEIVEDGDRTSVTGVVRGIQGDLKEYQKLFKDIKKLNTALTKAVVETLLKDNVVGEKEQHSLPAHYNIAGINTMDFIIAMCEHNRTNQRETFYLANTLKYLIRYKNKNGLEDLNKAKDYLNRLIEYTTIENLPFYNVDGQGD